MSWQRNYIWIREGTLSKRLRASLLFLGSLLARTGEAYLAGAGGCRQIAQSVEPPWAMALCCGSAAFGGLSGFFQTQNVLQDSGLSCGRYFLWKLTQGCLAAVIVVLWFFLLGAYPGI